MNALDAKKQLILEQELRFADAIARAVFEKPKVSYWMVLLPILFVFFVYRMQQYKQGRRKFKDDFMITRRRALEAAYQALVMNSAPDIESVIRQATLGQALQGPYRDWVSVQTGLYCDLLAAEGKNFDALVRTVYSNRGVFLLMLNRLSTVERAFYSALQGDEAMSRTAGAADIIATIETQSRQLRRQLAEQIFP